MSTEVPCCMGMAARDNCTCDAGPVIARSEAVRRMVAAEAERDRLAAEVETLRARLAAVEALADEWEQGTTAHEQAYQRANARRMPDKPEAGLNHLGAAHAMALCATRLRAALEVPDA